MPRDPAAEAALANVEKLISRGLYEAARRAVDKVAIGEGPLGNAYALLLTDAMVRAGIGEGDRHLSRGDTRAAKAAYEEALKIPSDLRAVGGVYAMTVRAMTRLTGQRTDLVNHLLDMAARSDYGKWCKTRNGLNTSSVVQVSLLENKNLISDLPVGELLGKRRLGSFPPHPAPGWEPAVADAERDPVSVLLVERPALMPGVAFEADTPQPLAVENLAQLAQGDAPTKDATETDVVGLSAALPLMSSLIELQARVVAIDRGLNRYGWAPASTPLLRYEYLQRQALGVLDALDHVDRQMITSQLELDEFAELIETVRRQMQQQTAELQSATERVDELQKVLVMLRLDEREIELAVLQLKKAEDECDPEWWEVLLSVVFVIGATAIGAGAGFLVDGLSGAITGETLALLTGVTETVKVWSNRTITCDNVSRARLAFEMALLGLKAAVADTAAELQHALLVRDVLTTELVSLQHTYDEAIASNQARVLNAATLGRVLSSLETIRRDLLFRAHTLAAMAEVSFNAENDADVSLIRDVHTDYLEPQSQGYTAGPALRRDVMGLEHIRQTARAPKRMQVTQTLSLRKHAPMSFAALMMSGGARFVTTLDDFDRWYPGTYQQRIREVRVAVISDDAGWPVRGYLTNTGVSFVRFLDVGNRHPVDGRDVLEETDPEVAQLCFKRRRRHQAVGTMAFPEMRSPRADDRAVRLQHEELNFFENCGLETTWKLELLPEQAVDLALVRDVRIVFQYDALYDATLRRVIEAKRYVDRHETALVSAREVLSQAGQPVEFQHPFDLTVSPYLFEDPNRPKTIEQVGLLIRPRGAATLPGAATIRMDYNAAGEVEVETNEVGMVATAQAHPAGVNTDALATLAVGKPVTGTWRIEVTTLPAGVSAEDLYDVLLLLNYAYDLM